MHENPPPIRLIAHRGLSSIYPENTLAALEAAVACGARCVEFDVQFTADDVPVLLHDVTLERTTGVAGHLGETTSAQLEYLSAGEPERFGDQFKNTPIPTLAEAVQITGNCPGLTTFIDVKDEGVERLSAERVLGLILAHLGSQRSSYVITSAKRDLIRCAFSEGLSTALVVDDATTASQARAADVAADHVFCHLAGVDAVGGILPQLAWRWAIYGVETSVDADRMVAGGAHFIETRSFDVLHRHLFNSSRSAADDVAM